MLVGFENEQGNDWLLDDIDSNRKLWHQQKMASKLDRSLKQRQALCLVEPPAFVHHKLLKTIE
jgi:hypothetical protein